MKGIELCREYYYAYGEAMLRERFPEIYAAAAIGLVGGGSECLGYDDDISQDHDFEPGFCIFLSCGDFDEATLFNLERAYAGLPREFEGVKRSVTAPVGGSRHGVIMIEDLLMSKTGMRTLPQCDEDWFGIPEYALCELTGGELFYDDVGIFSRIRAQMAHYPQDVKLKKLAGQLLLAGQAGQYNYSRCIAHGERGAAQLAAGEFVNSVMAIAFLLADKYMPYYKWRFRALRECSALGEALAYPLEFLLTTDNSPRSVKIKSEVIEDIARMISDELRVQGLTPATDAELERHAYAVNDKIKSGDIRNKHVLFAV